MARAGRNVLIVSPTSHVQDDKTAVRCWASTCPTWQDAGLSRGRTDLARASLLGLAEAGGKLRVLQLRRFLKAGSASFPFHKQPGALRHQRGARGEEGS